MADDVAKENAEHIYLYLMANAEIDSLANWAAETNGESVDGKCLTEAFHGRVGQS